MLNGMGVRLSVRSWLCLCKLLGHLRAQVGLHGIA
jgi:hypothetical protein